MPPLCQSAAREPAKGRLRPTTQQAGHTRRQRRQHRTGTDMARRGLVTFGVGLAAGAVAYATLSSGAVAGGAHDLVGAVGGVFRFPEAEAAGLPTFEDCTELRQWYVEQALPRVGPWGFGGGPVMTRGGGAGPGPAAVAPQRSAGSDADDAVASSGTGTNVQEVGVEESDV